MLWLSAVVMMAGLIHPTRAFSVAIPTTTTPRSLVSLASTTTTRSNNDATTTTKDEKTKVPVTLLSGFLGAGKTSTLKHLLENTEGIKIAVIVNDVAAINIDAKLIANQHSDSDSSMIQLENGCACCSLSDELLTAVDTLIQDDDDDDSAEESFDALVVELSGVADPVSVQQSWQMAELDDHPATKKSSVEKIITLVDACTFGQDWMTSDSAGERADWSTEIDDDDRCVENRAVTELLAEQVEAANLILVNKADLATPQQVQVASALAQAINKEAQLETVQYGRLSPTQLLGNVLVEEKEKSGCKNTKCEDTKCGNSKCGETREEEETAASSCGNSACSDPDCTDASSPTCGSKSATTNDDDDDNDTVLEATDSHDHSHSHEHATTQDTSSHLDDLGITSFVYKRDRPFHPKRLLTVLNEWPVPVKDDLDLTVLQEAQQDGYTIGPDTYVGIDSNPFVGVLRSKGFCWVAPQKWTGANNDADRHDHAMHWSHAGKQMGISIAGKWWGTVPMEAMKQYFEKEALDKLIRDDFVSEEWGDRRQELVFIGTGISEEAITTALDGCLLTESQMKVYRKRVQDYAP